MEEDTQDITRNNGIAIQDGKNNKYDITQYIGKSIEYNELVDHLEGLKKHYSRIPKDETAELSEYAQKIRKQKEIIEKFKQGVRKLAESFDKIEINTERLRLAKQYFEEGKFKEADTILKIEDIEKDQESLLKQKG